MTAADETTMQTSDNNIPRRCRIDLFTPAERAIYDAMQVVEAAGAHVRLTDAVNLLRQARDAVADGVEALGQTTVAPVEEGRGDDK